MVIEDDIRFLPIPRRPAVPNPFLEAPLAQNLIGLCQRRLYVDIFYYETHVKYMYGVYIHAKFHLVIEDELIWKQTPITFCYLMG